MAGYDFNASYGGYAGESAGAPTPSLGLYRVLGGLGSIFWALAGPVQALPHPVFLVVGLVVAFVAAVFLLLAVRGIGRAVGAKGAFAWTLTAVILWIPAILILALFVSASAMGPPEDLTDDEIIAGVVCAAICAVVFGVAVTVLQSYCFYKAFDELGARTDSSLLKSSGTTIFAGACLMILLIGIPVYAVGWIMAAIAFFTLPQPSLASYGTGFGMPLSVPPQAPVAPAPGTDAAHWPASHAGEEIQAIPVPPESGYESEQPPAPTGPRLLSCPSCGAQLVLRATKTVPRVRCRKCGTIFNVS